MMTIHGVGHITALTFVLTLGDKSWFGRSRDVGCYLGLRPKRSQSGERDPQLGITKTGNAYLPTTSCDPMVETRHFDSGDCIWQHAAASR
jgi:transposase